MKLLGYFLFFGLILSACGSNENEDETTLADNFEIKGKIAGAENQSVVIQAQTDRGAVEIARGKVENNGTYALKGNIPAFGIYTMTIGGSNTNALILPININEKMVVSGNLKEIAIYPHISGVEWAKPLMWYMKSLNDFSTEYMIDETKHTAAEREAGKNKFVKEVQKQIISNPGSQANIIMVSALFPNQDEGFASYDKQNLLALERMNEAYQKKFPNSPITAMLAQNIGGIQSGYDNYYNTTSGSIAASEISLPNPDGRQMRLSDLKGKVVLIDFWASWCAPCRGENPNVVRLYNKYRSKGFEVFSVSLDNDKEAWKKAIAKDGLIWKNHVSDLMGWQTPLVQQYGFNGIPHTVLVNREGKIIGIKLRGEQLEQKLEEIFGN